MKKRKISDITMILIAMLLGSLAGIIIGKPATYIGFIGDIWLNLMKMFLVPIVVCMLVKGISSMDSPEALGRIGIKIIVFYNHLCRSSWHWCHQYPQPGQRL